MCSEYKLYAEMGKLQEFGLKIRNPGHLPERFETHTKIYGEAPIIVMKQNGDLVWERAQFSLLPPPPRFSTFNARLADWDERRNQEIPIYEKSTWRKPFAATRCLIPMTQFLEPIYSGEHAGTVQAFRARGEEILLAPGMWQESPNPKKPGELYTGFSMIIHTPLEFVLQTGHHRSPVLLTPHDGATYLKESMTTAERYGFLLTHRHKPALEAQTERQMARGWEKRVKVNVDAHEEEMQFVKRFVSAHGRFIQISGPKQIP